MAVLKVTDLFLADIEKVYNIVTDVENYQWRSDLSRTEVINDQQFIEYTKENYQTTFTVTAKIPYQRWEFDMENENMKGHWIGIFKEVNDHTQIEFIENVEAKKLIMKPFVKGYLKKQQAQFINDLKKVL